VLKNLGIFNRKRGGDDYHNRNRNGEGGAGGRHCIGIHHCPYTGAGMSTEIYLHISATPYLGEDKIHIMTAAKNYAHTLEVIQKIVDADDSGKYELVVMPSAMLREEFNQKKG
jgi:hypothetical protein